MELQVIQNRIFEVRGYKVMLDMHLAEMYDVETKRLKEAVKRNRARFPGDFMFELTLVEFENLRSQFVTSSWGGTRYMPYAFTEQGVAMLSSVLRSEKAVTVNISIMRAFVLMRQHAMNYKDVQEKIKKLEEECQVKFKDIYEAINYLLSPKAKRDPIGFRVDRGNK